jgi:putative transposase
VQKVDPQPSEGQNPNHVAVDEIVIRINDQQLWLYAAADLDTNDLLHLRLFSTTTTALTEIFFPRTSSKTRYPVRRIFVDGA